MKKKLLYIFVFISIFISGMLCDNSTDNSSNNDEPGEVSLPNNVIISIPEGI